MFTITPRRVVTLLGIAAAAAAAVGLVYAGPIVLAWKPGPQATFWILALTVAAALWYAWLTYRLLGVQQTPTLVVTYEDGHTVVRNLGHGAALNILLTDSKGHTLDRAADLQAGASAVMPAAIDWSIAEARYVFCRDVGGRWHMTKCLGQSLSPAHYIPVNNQVIGRVFNAPPEVRRAAAVRSAVEEIVQVSCNWDPRNWIQRARYHIQKRRAENRIMRLIREATVEGRLGETFSAAEVSAATELERVVAERFLPSHVVSNALGERELFTRDPDGRYRLK